ncbi:DNA replication factor C, large subunit [Mytilinidion resinicola]|uniref:Replication factor C subunit 1 n=1 Tax=Mytilinidion resinicola TaxID=574789 RepID=A0A6A6YLN9_9PEZI|nr:DNA replication factor C, large subunit [Mytilinidion resinicola]KAF2808895.1 DNA replication factor C, large subunit [Mytilinidion resinicola]
MPADIRSFFGGGAQSRSQGSQQSQKPPSKKVETSTKKKPGRPARKIVEDSDDEEEYEEKPKKATPKKPTPKKQIKRAPSPEGEATTTSEFFGSKNKPKRSEVPTPSKLNGKTTKALPVTPSTNGKTSARAKKPVTYAALKDEDEDFFDDDLDGGDDIFTANFKKNGKRDDYVEIEDDEDDDPIVLPVRATPKKSAQKKSIKDEDDFEPNEDIDMKDADPEDDERILVDKPAKANAKKPRATLKRKSVELDDEEEEPPKKGRGRKAQDAKKSPVKKKAKKEDATESSAVQAIYDSIPLVRPPTPPPQNEEAAKFKFGGGNQGAQPTGGSMEMPTGAENCLAGLTFVFTGVGQFWQREEAQALVKRYGGKVTTAPSKKTSYVVLGSDAGPSKLRKIKENGIKTIDENGLAELIRRLPPNGGDGKAAAEYEKKLAIEAKKIEEAAAEMEREERKQAAQRKKDEDIKQKALGGASASKAPLPAAKGNEPEVDSRLWTVKYAPSSLGQICGNKAPVEKLQRWLNKFQKNQKTGFKMAGPDGSGTFRAVIIHGPPGIGKTTAAHLVAKLEGYDVVESNASDTRSKKMVENGLKGVLSTTSLLGYFSGDGKQVEASKKKLVLIMDEVDGMSAGDRGGVGALAAVCKKTQIPMILICNDRRLPKMKPFDYCTFDLQFRRPTVDNIRSRISTIAFREGLKLPPNVINALIEGSHADIRQVVNMISTAKLDQTSMNFDKGKEMSKSWEKHVILKPWDITNKILGGGMFAESSKATLNDKIELYFNDHEFSYLMLEENYLGTNPMRALSYQGREKNLKQLELVEQAAESISDGDLVDRMIHGSQQQWSLMPTHAVFSFVRPASFVSGSLAGNQTRFTSWLGKNSNQQKLTRFVKEIQGHMRLRSSGDRHEIRQQYIPVLWEKMVKKLQVEGKEAVPEVIDLLDSYFLTKDDFDAIMELGVGYMDQEKVKLETQAKASFTRMYNQQSHPLSFMKASSVAAPKKAAKEKPDLEEAIEESDEEEVVEEAKDDDDDADLSKDKYVKQPKKKKAPAGKGKGKKVKDEDDDMDIDEDVKPKPKAKAKGRPKKT